KKSYVITLLVVHWFISYMIHTKLSLLWPCLLTPFFILSYGKELFPNIKLRAAIVLIPFLIAFIGQTQIRSEKNTMGEWLKGKSTEAQSLSLEETDFGIPPIEDKCKG